MELTLPQQDIYFEQLMYPDEPIYNIGAKIEIIGCLDVAALKLAFVSLINQHDAYRMVLEIHDDYPKPIFLSEHDAELQFIDFSSTPNSEEMADTFMKNEFAKPFDLFSGQLLHKFILIKVAENFHFLFSAYHHIITDGWGTSIMFQRLVQNYNEISEHGSVVSNYPYRYTDYILDDSIYQQSDYFLKDQKYWTDKFSSLPENFLEKINPKIDLHKSARTELILQRVFYNKLIALAKEEKCSVVHIILAVLFTYFSRKHQVSSLAIGLPTLNRSKAVYKKTVGLFMGISPLKIDLDLEHSILELARNIRQQLRLDYRYQRFPLGRLIKELNIFKEKEKIFNITLSYEKQNYSNNFTGTKTKVVPMTHSSERVGLAIYVREFVEHEDVKIDFDYNLNFFNETSASTLALHFKTLLKEFARNPDQKIKTINYLTASEKQKLLFDFNNTNTPLDSKITFLDLFQQQCLKFSDKTAVSDGETQLTYRQLEKQSNQIASFLNHKFDAYGKKPIAVLLHRSTSLIAVLLGIIKSERCYIPLDPDFPKERLDYIIQDSHCKIIVTGKNNVLKERENVLMFNIEQLLEESSNRPNQVSKPIKQENSAYIIYTSGTTGHPKGVEIGHLSLLNFLTSMQQQPGLDESDLVFSVTTYSFDISILEFFGSLISGATLYVARSTILADPEAILEEIELFQPTWIQATPSFYQMLVNEGWKGNDKLKICCGGDLLSESLAAKLLSFSKEVWNMYGPTETTIWSSVKKIISPEDANNIGKPINNTNFYILDPYLQLLPTENPGVLFIGGKGLAKGYFGNKRLTAQKFINNPFIAGELIYETGDLGKWNTAGEIEFIGRNDNQVKIRGYRIELGDIESKLQQISGIKTAVVVSRKEEEQGAVLIAFIIVEDQTPSDNYLIGELKKKLPKYMVPQIFIVIDQFPMTPNRKVDRKKLAGWEIHKNKKEHTFIAPHSALEIQLANYWQDILKTTHLLSIDDNFFSQGGHSLSAVKLAAQIKKQYGKQVSLKTIFDFPTLRELSNHLESLSSESSVTIGKAEIKTKYSLTPAQKNIWQASQDEDLSIAYNMSIAYQIAGKLDVKKFLESISKMIMKHEILRTVFVEENGIPFQKIRPVDTIDLESLLDQHDINKSPHGINEFINKPFDLSKGLLLRILYLKSQKETDILVFSTHHIIMDGWSLEFFIKAIIEYYNSDNNDDLNTIQPGFQFKDYSEWLDFNLKKSEMANLMFWKNYLNGFSTKENFALDFDGQKTNQKGCQDFKFSKKITELLKERALKKKVTLHTLVVALLNVLIFKISGHMDICIGTVNAGRPFAVLQSQLGMFVKTLPLRTSIVADMKFSELLTNVQENLLEVDKFQDVPYEQLDNASIDLILVFQNAGFSYENIDNLKDIKLKSLSIKEAKSRLPLIFNFIEMDGHLAGSIDFNSSYYEDATIKLIINKLEILVEYLLEHQESKLQDIEMLSDFEKEKTIDIEFNF